MTGTLYAIGVGPGDPELLTLKAVRILRDSACICVPKGREEGSSLALSIIEGAVDLNGKEVIEAVFPMKKTKAERGSAEDNLQELEERWDETAVRILKRLNRGIDVAFVTIGDPTIYSTFFYLYSRLNAIAPTIRTDIIPGVSSITAAAAMAGISLGLADGKIAVLPATYAGDLSGILAEFETVVLMKVHRVFADVFAKLTEAGLSKHSTYVSRAGMKAGSVIKNLPDVRDEDLNYFSLIIVRRTSGA